MFLFTFFAKREPFSEITFRIHLQNAIDIISQNESSIASLVLKAIDSGEVTIKSFLKLTPEHFLRMQQSMLEDDGIELSDYPPTQDTAKLIAGQMDGIIYNDTHIYLSPFLGPEELARTLIHEVCHHLNARINQQERETLGPSRASYCDEVRSFIAEKVFLRNGRFLLRSDIKGVHATVTRQYPEFASSNPISGYIFSSYDNPYSTS